MDGRPVGQVGFTEVGLPDLQMLLSRPLGNGSAAVCDVDPEGLIGGVPAVHPPVFSDVPATVDAINDLGCRVNDGTGSPRARNASNLACTRFETGDFSFVDPATQAQFCVPIAQAWEFPLGDTIVTARARSVAGSIGDPRQIVVRVGRGVTNSPTPTATRIPTVTGLPTTTPTPTISSTPIPPVITYMGIAAADDRIVSAADVDGDGRDIYGRLIGHAFSLVVEASPGLGGRPVGVIAYSDGVSLPDLHMLVTRDLGDGNPEVCDVDIENSIFGGIPGIDPPLFSDSVGVIDAINDLGCRVNDGTGSPVGRTLVSPCTRDSLGEFTFVNPLSTVQFCLPIARAWRYPEGDTITAARVRSIDGALSAVEEIVVRVEEAERDECGEGDLGERIFSTVSSDSALRAAGVEGDVGSEWVATPARFCAGPGESGLHPLRLLSDFTVGMTLAGGDVLCARFDAAGSDGLLDCAGSTAHGLRYAVDADNGEVDRQFELGSPTGAGAATLTVPVAFRVLAGPATSDECFGAEFGSRTTLGLTTAAAEAEVLHSSAGELAITATGDNFDCDDWTAEDGPGTFAMPIATLDDTGAIVESASIFILDD
jgi:hypothetical protein